MTDLQDRLIDYLQTIKFGSWQVAGKNYAGKTTVLDVFSEETVRYKDNIKALAQVIQMLKQNCEKQFSGSTTITVVYKNGDIKEISKQSIKRFLDSG